MKTIYKVLISFVIGVCFIVAGISMGGAKQINKNQFAFMNHLDIEWSPNKKDDIEYIAQSSINELEIVTTVADIEFQEKKDIKNIQVDVSNVYSGLKVDEDGHKLIIKQPSYWINNGKSRKAKISIVVPQGYQFEKVEVNANLGETKIENLNTNDLSIENSMGKLTMEDVVCYNMEIDAGMSQTDLKKVTCYKNLNIDLGMGEVKILLNNHKHDYNYNVDVGMGEVQIGDEKFSGFAEKSSHHNDLKSCQIDVDCGMGSVKVEMED